MGLVGLGAQPSSWGPRGGQTSKGWSNFFAGRLESKLLTFQSLGSPWNGNKSTDLEGPVRRPGRRCPLFACPRCIGFVGLPEQTTAGWAAFIRGNWSSMVLEARSLESRCQRGRAPSEASRPVSFLVSSSFWGSRRGLACGRVPLVCASVCLRSLSVSLHLPPLFLSLSLFLFFVF